MRWQNADLRRGITIQAGRRPEAARLAICFKSIPCSHGDIVGATWWSTYMMVSSATNPSIPVSRIKKLITGKRSNGQEPNMQSHNRHDSGFASSSRSSTLVVSSPIDP